MVLELFREWFRFDPYCQARMCWACSRCIKEGETLLDSSEPSDPTHYVAIPWSRVLYGAITKRPEGEC